MLYAIEYTYKKFNTTFTQQMYTVFEEEPTKKEALEYWYHHLKDDNDELLYTNIKKLSTMKSIKSLL